MRTYPLYSLSLEETMRLQFKVTDCITGELEGREFLDRGDLGAVVGLNKPATTSKVEQAIARIFDIRAYVLTRGAGSGAIQFGLHAMLTCGGKVLIHKVPVYNTTGMPFDMLGLVPVEADSSDLPSVEAVPRVDPDIKGTLVQYTRQKLDDYYDIYKVVKIIKAARGTPVLTDDNYAMTKVKNVRIQCGTDLSCFLAFKLLGPEGIDVIAGRKQYINRLVSESYSGGIRTQGHETLDVLRGLIYAPVVLAIQAQASEECVNRLKTGEIPQVRDAFLANVQSKMSLAESYKNTAERVLEEAGKLGAALNPMEAEPRYEMVPVFYRVPKTFRRTDPILEHRMIRINPVRVGVDTILKIVKEPIERAKQMFLNQTTRQNRELVEIAFTPRQEGRMLSDSYVVDVDVLLGNTHRLLHRAEENHIKLHFMLRQIGRNSYLAEASVELRYSDAMVVDCREGLVMTRHNIPIGNAGHLVQVPEALIKNMVAHGPGVMTVYLREKVMEIQAMATELGRRQALMSRIYGDFDMIYSGQTADLHLNELKETAIQVKIECSRLETKGVISSPCYPYDKTTRDMLPTRNLETVRRAAKVLETCGVDVTLMNTPSTICCHTINKMVESGGDCEEPGHGLNGTTPMHAEHNLEEILAVAYISETFHSFTENAYYSSGSHYRRFHMKHVLVGKGLKDNRDLAVIPPVDEGIDYRSGISEECTVGDATVMAFCFQIFITRSDVALAKGIRKGRPEIIGTYDSQRRKKEEL